MSADGSIATGNSGNLTPWPKGVSGNKSGLTREQSRKRRAVKRLALDACEEAMSTIIDLMRTSEHDVVRLQAAVEVRNSAIGKPKLRDLTREEVEAEVDKRLRELAKQANEMRARGALDVTPK